jgi:hypothetical protein
MPNEHPFDCAQDCLRRAMLTEDVDQQCLLLFLAEAWETIARTGELRDVVPAYLGQPAATNQRCPANAQQ